jgi:uncharacterized tellurite resistance protein B-like protein
MHIVIGVITALAGLIWAFVALQRAGIDLNALNPFLWQRRALWKKKYGEKPIYTLSSPMEVAALMLLGIAKCEGEISAQQKKTIIDIFENEFHLGHDEAADLMLASAHLLRNEIYLVDHLDRILAKSATHFSAGQSASLLQLMQKVAVIEGPVNEEQRKLIQALEDYFTRRSAAQGKWA